MNKVEIRTIADKYRPKLREVNGQSTRIIEGYAAVFNVLSEVILDYEEDNYMFREVITPTAITQERLKRYDIKMTMFHNREKLLARSRYGAGSLTLSVDDTGLKFSAEMPNTDLGNEALEMVKRGDIVGASFAYLNSKDGVTWSYEGEVPTRTVTDIIDIKDVTLAIDPAFNQTSVSLRELSRPAERPTKRIKITHYINDLKIGEL